MDAILPSSSSLAVNSYNATASRLELEARAEEEQAALGRRNKQQQQQQQQQQQRGMP